MNNGDRLSRCCCVVLFSLPLVVGGCKVFKPIGEGFEKGFNEMVSDDGAGKSAGTGGPPTAADKTGMQNTVATGQMVESERDRIHAMRTDVAWAYLRNEIPAKEVGINTDEVMNALLRRAIFGNRVASEIEQQEAYEKHNKERAKQLERNQIQADAARALYTSKTPSRAFNAMAKEFSTELSKMLEKVKIENRGVVAFGRFKDYSQYGAYERDGSLPFALEGMRDQLANNKAVTDRFRLQPYGSIEEREDLILKIGGGSKKWLEPGGENALDVELKTFHPDDIFILTGGFNQALSDYGVEFTFRARLESPRRGEIVGGTAVEKTQNYLYHPTRGWITPEENAKLWMPEGWKPRV